MNLQLYLLATIAIASIAFVAWGIIYTRTTGKPFIVIDTGRPKSDVGDATDAEIVEYVSLDSLQGTWEMVSVGRNGNFAPKHVIEEGNVVMEITGSEFRLVDTHEGGKLKLDNSVSPNHMDQLVDDGDVHHCVVRFRSRELEICQAEAGKKRPKDFSSQRHDGASLTRFQRMEETPADNPVAYG
jgi:uncharacterized protein (TIGR03067 family)